MKKQPVIVIVGPTASGKSALGVELAKRFNGEIISADSRQVYRGLDIGTGKITKREMRGIPHHLLDVASPKRPYSAGSFVTDARRAIKAISARGKLPIIVGGTGFYIDALLGRIALPDVPPNPLLRKRLAAKTVAQLFAQIKRRDPVRAAALSSPSERNNKVRLIRALEIAMAKPAAVSKPAAVAPLWVGIAPNDEFLKKKITVRLHERIRHGMRAEAERLHASGITYKRMTELGLEYRSLARLLQNKISRQEFERELASDIWRYSRKQLSYWKRNSEIRWFKPTAARAITGAVRAWLRRNPGSSRS